MVHQWGICESASVGAGTRVWAFAHVLAGARIGRDCNICDHTFIENQVTIGDRVTIKNHVSVWDGVVIEDDVFVGPGVVFTNDRYPRSKRHLASYPRTVIGRGASLGGGAIILPGVTVGAFCMVGAGALVGKDLPPFSLAVGRPARVRGLVCRCGAPLRPREEGGYRCSQGSWQGPHPHPEMECSS